MTTKTDNEIDSPGIEALEEFVDEERDPEDVVGTEVETGVSEEFNMADKFDEGDSKNFKHSSPARKFNIFGKNVVKIIVF